MRIAFLIAPLISVLGFSWTVKAQPLALKSLIDNSDRVAVCKTDNENLGLINFYVHKVNPMIVAQMQSQRGERFYSLNMSEDKSIVTLTSDKEIVALAFDLYFKAADQNFTVSFDREAIDNPGKKFFFSTLTYENGKTIDIACKRGSLD